MLLIKPGEMIDRDATLRKLVDMQYSRNDQALGRGTFRVRGETLEVFPAYAETAYRAVLFGDEVEKLQEFDPLTGEVSKDLEHAGIWPATHYATDRQTIERARRRDPRRARGPLRGARGRGQAARVPPPAPAHPVRHGDAARARASATGSRTTRASWTAGRPATRPYCLLDFFPDDFVCFIDESHQTVPQIGGMYEGDRSRKQTLVELRLPAAERAGQPPPDLRRVPRDHPADRVRLGHAGRLRAHPLDPGGGADRHGPTGIVDPEVDVRETKNQIDDLMNEIRGQHRGRRAHARHDPDEEDVRGPDRLPDGVRGARCATCTPRSTPSSGYRSSASCDSASSTCSWGSTCCARASTCPRCRSWRSSTPTRRASCAARPR